MKKIKKKISCYWADESLWPVKYNGKEWTYFDCEQIFLNYYTCDLALRADGGVYAHEGIIVYPDGTTNNKKKSCYNG